MAVLDTRQEVGYVAMRGALERIRDGKSQVLVLDIGPHLVHLLEGLGDFLLPGVGVGDDMGYMALVGTGRPDRADGVEVDSTARAFGIVGGENRPQRGHAAGGFRDRAVDLLGGAV